MRYGYCLRAEDFLPGENGASVAAKLKDSGYEYFETALVTLAYMPEDKFEQLLSAVKKEKTGIEALNIFFPGDIKLTGGKTDNCKVSEYLDIALSRALRVGAKIIVFGSAGARSVPEGFPHQKAFEQLIGYLRLVSDKAKGLKIAIEPLNKKETNIINTVKEGYELVKKVNRQNIMLLADYYHMAVDNDPLESISKYGDKICHIHAADPDGRMLPTKMKDEYALFFEQLKKINYNGRISFECGYKDLLADAKKAIDIFKAIEKK